MQKSAGRHEKYPYTDPTGRRKLLVAEATRRAKTAKTAEGPKTEVLPDMKSTKGGGK